MNRVYLTLLLAVLALGQELLYAQESVKIRVSGEAVLDELLPRNFVYEYSDFQNGRIYVEGDRSYSVKLNINLVSGELHFIDQDGEIKQIDKSYMVKFVAVGRDVWFPVEKSFAKSICSRDGSYLLLSKKTAILNISQETAFGGNSKTSSVKSVTLITMDNNSQQLIPVGDYEFKIRRNYYIMEEDGDSYSADIGGFKKFFKRQREEIERFVKEKELNLDKESDIITIFKSFAGSVE